MKKQDIIRNFNSTMVRLKAQVAGGVYAPEVHFNSTMVRLKASCVVLLFG